MDWGASQSCVFSMTVEGEHEDGERMKPTPWGEETRGVGLFMARIENGSG